MTDASKRSGFVICGTASRADEVEARRARDSSIRHAKTLASAVAARTSKLHVCVQREAGLVQKLKMISNSYG